jgi:hypothetical protein
MPDRALARAWSSHRKAILAGGPASSGLGRQEDAASRSLLIGKSANRNLEQQEQVLEEDGLTKLPTPACKFGLAFTAFMHTMGYKCAVNIHQ